MSFTCSQLNIQLINVIQALNAWHRHLIEFQIPSLNELYLKKNLFCILFFPRVCLLLIPTHLKEALTPLLE